MILDRAYYAFLEEVEGKRAHAYPDSGGVPTIGIGHALTQSERMSGKIKIGEVRVRYRHGLTESQILQLCRQDSQFAAAAVNNLVKVALTQNQFNALVSFTFNVGTGEDGFAGSTLLRLLNQGLYKEIPRQMRRWKYDNGHIKEGLINRREKEIKLWLS